MTSPALPAPAAGVVFQPLDDGAVVFSTVTEVYFGLNHVGAAVWELLGAGGDIAGLCAALQARYPDAAADVLAADVAALLATLAREGLVVEAAAGTGDAAPAG